jgi:L,D-transpeptidase ErfK/SrfK
MWRRAATLGLAAALLGGCALLKRSAPAATALPTFDETSFAAKPLPSYVLRPAPGGAIPADTVIGKRGTYRIRQNDTLLDVARYFDLGYNEIVAANPGVDPWIPPVGSTVVIPTEWILPCCTYEGLVLNIPEMRLFYFERSARDPAAIVVRTYPVGLGTEDRKTPRGRFHVRGKTVNPRWVIPQSIRAEHIRERGDPRTSIPGGDPDNPLGKYRIELSIPLYTIHGTNIPWGAGMTVSHGCARLYPEDIEQLFPLVAVGTPVEFVYQPAKAGRRGDGIFVETHADIYRYRRSLYGEALASLRRQGLEARVDPSRVSAAVKDASGLPLRVK